MIWLGELGGLVSLPCPVSEQTSRGARVQVKTTLGGVAKAVVAPFRPRRVWGVNFSNLTDPSALNFIQAMQDGALGAEPFCAILPLGQIANLLTPEQGYFRAQTSAGTLMSGGVFEGVFLPNHFSPSTTFAIDRIVVPPGRSVTASAWLAGAGNFSVTFFNAGNVQIGAEAVPYSAGTLSRATVTASTPATTAYARLVATGATSVAGPCLTLSERPLDYVPGSGVAKVVLTSVDESTISTAPGMRRIARSITLSEVG